MKTAVFLGAGASKVDGIPVQSELFRKYFQQLRGKGWAELRQAEQELCAYFQVLFGIDVSSCDLDKAAFPTFEEAIGILDLAVIRDETFQGLQDKNIRLLRHYLVKLMTTVIEDNPASYHNYHRQLVKNLKKNGRIRDTVFVSTNYDTLLDQAIVSLLPEADLDYGIDFVGRQDPKPASSIKLYKLHGSLNWLYCPACSTVSLAPFQKTPASCGECGAALSTLIVPPTYFKNINNVYLATVWNQAEIALKEVEQLIFCGYSFPDADLHIKYLLKRIQTCRRQKPRITVINNYPGKTKESITNEKYRFQRFLGEQVDYAAVSFEEFASSGEF